MSDPNWIDTAALEKSKSSAYLKVILFLGTTCIFLAAGIATCSYFYFSNIDEKKSTIIALPPPESETPIEYTPGSMVSDKYIVRVAQAIVECLSNFTWETLEDRIKRRCSSYLTETMLNEYEANLLTTNFVAKVKKQKMVSSFVVNRDSLKGGWCKKIASSCAKVCGDLHRYVNGNVPYSKKEICYFILSRFTYPTKENPFVVRASRLLLFENDDPSAKASRFLSDAQKGIVPGVAH